jgi:outer membrane protein TolC
MMARAARFALLLAACVPPASDLRRPVELELARRLRDDGPLVPRADVRARLAQPLDAAAAARIALATSARVQAALAEVGVAGGDLALGLGPTSVELSYRTGGGASELEAAVMQDVIGAVTAARRRGAARANVAAAQADATALALLLVVRVERAFHDVLAAQEELAQRRIAFDAADAAALVRERMHAAGTASELARARERDAREQARLELARAEAAVELRREALNALLGLTGDETRWTAAGTLPEPPAAAPQLDELEAGAVTTSLALIAALERTDAAANDAGAERLRGFVPRLELGVAITRDSAHDYTHVGPAISIGLPIFDQNAGGRARAAAAQRRAAHELTAIAVELRAAARAARITALAAHAEARHVRDVVLPLRQQILDETLRHYNAMDADPFALLAARRELAEAHHQDVEARRRYANAMAVVRGLWRGVSVDGVSNDEQEAR